MLGNYQVEALRIITGLPICQNPHKEIMPSHRKAKDHIASGCCPTTRLPAPIRTTHPAGTPTMIAMVGEPPLLDFSFAFYDYSVWLDPPAEREL